MIPASIELIQTSDSRRYWPEDAQAGDEFLLKTGKLWRIAMFDGKDYIDVYTRTRVEQHVTCYGKLSA